jgi:hypothetical protein
MKAAEVQSRFNGLEYLMVRKPLLWHDIQEVISSVDATQCRTKVQSEAEQARMLYNSVKLDSAFRSLLRARGWDESWETAFVKDRVAVEVQFGKYAFVAYDLFVKHLAFYVGDHIDVGVEILPMKSLQMEMSSGVPYYEGELYNVIRQGRGVPAVPLLIIGVEP